MENKVYIPFTFKGKDGSIVSMTSIEEINDFQRSDNYPSGEGEQEFIDAWDAYIWDFIVWTAENNKKKDEDKEECPYDFDFIRDMIDGGDFICNSDDDGRRRLRQHLR